MKKKLVVILICVVMLLGLCAVVIFVLNKEKPVVKPATTDEYLEIMTDTVENKSSGYFQASISEGFFDSSKKTPYSLVSGIIKNGEVSAKIVDKKTKEYSKKYEGTYNLNFEKKSESTLSFSKVNPSDCETLDEGYTISCKTIEDSSDDANIIKKASFYTLQYNDRYELSVFKNYTIEYKGEKSLSEEIYSNEKLENLLLSQNLNMMYYEFEERIEIGEKVPKVTFSSIKILYGEMSEERKYLEIANDTLSSNKQGSTSGAIDATYYYSESSLSKTEGIVKSNVNDISEYNKYKEIPVANYESTLEGSRQRGKVRNSIFASNEYRDRECKFNGEKLILTCSYNILEEMTSEREREKGIASYTGTKAIVVYKFDKNDKLKEFTFKFSALHLNDMSYYKTDTVKTEEEFKNSINDYNDLENQKVENNNVIHEDVLSSGYGGYYYYYENKVDYEK